MRPIYEHPAFSPGTAAAAAGTAYAPYGRRFNARSPRGSPKGSPRGSPRARRRVCLRQNLAATSRSRSMSPASAAFPKIQVHGIFLSRRFVRDSGLLRDLFATCGLPTNGQENVLEDFLDASMLELVVTAHRNFRSVRLMLDATLIEVLCGADYLLNDVVYYTVVEEIARRLGRTRDLSSWKDLLACQRPLFLDIAAHLPDLVAYFLMRESIISKHEYRLLPRLRSNATQARAAPLKAATSSASM